jgi:hypothetical protein
MYAIEPSDNPHLQNNLVEFFGLVTSNWVTPPVDASTSRWQPVVTLRCRLALVGGGGAPWAS